MCDKQKKFILLTFIKRIIKKNSLNTLCCLYYVSECDTFFYDQEQTINIMIYNNKYFTLQLYSKFAKFILFVVIYDISVQSMNFINRFYFNNEMYWLG